jgi:hypothetical protein
MSKTNAIFGHEELNFNGKKGFNVYIYILVINVDKTNLIKLLTLSFQSNFSVHPGC